MGSVRQGSVSYTHLDVYKETALDQCAQIVVGVFDPRVQCRRQQEILVFDLFRGQAVAQTEERAIGTFPKVDRAVMPRTLQRQQQGNRAGRKGRRQIRLEAQLANRQIRFDGQVSQFARKCIIVMRDAVSVSYTHLDVYKRQAYAERLRVPHAL